jgi:ABC-type multidrug transport system fused ATPase/permease subunit
MSFPMGTSGQQMGARSILRHFGADDQPTSASNLRVVRRMLAYLRPHKWLMLAAFICMLFGTGFSLLYPYLIKVSIDQYIAQKDLSGLNWISIWIAGSLIGLYLAGASQQYLLSLVSQKVLAEIRSHLYRHIINISMSFHDKNIVGVLVSRVINDVAEINELITQGAITFLGDSLVLAGIIVIMLQMDAKLALLTFSVLPLIVFTTTLFAKRARSAFRDTRNKIAAVVGNLAEDLSGIRVIQAFAQEIFTQERFEEVNRENRDVTIQAVSLSYIFLPSIEFLSTLAMVIVLGFGGVLVSRNEITLGVLVAFVAYVSRFFQPIQEISRLFNTFQSALAAGEQVFKLLDMLPGVTDHAGADDLPSVKGRVELAQVCFRYQEDSPEVLHDISFVVEAGQKVALVGPTGAGKTSIAKLITRFYDVSDGSIQIDGIDVRQVSLNSLHRQAILVTQDPFLFSTTITENIRFGQLGASDMEVEAAAMSANAHDMILTLPDGYNTLVAEGSVNLSAGQKQLICLARAFLADPKILILDESTANIDTITEKMVQAAMNKLLNGRTAIIIAHRLNTVQNADMLFIIDRGMLVEFGKHDHLIKQQGVYKDLYTRQFAGILSEK